MNQAAIWTIGNMLLFGSAAVQRYFTELFSSSNQYYELSSPIVLDGDFEWELSYTGVAIGFSTILGSATGVRLARFEAGGAVGVYAGSVNSTSTTVANDNIIHTIGGKRVGDAVSVIIDGVVESTTSNPAAAGTMELQRLFERGGTTTSGIGFNFKAWKDGDRDTGTLVLDMPIDGDGTSSIVPNLADPSNNATRINQTSDNAFKVTEEDAAWVGENLWTYGAVSSTGSEGTATTIISNSVLLTGATYRWSFTAKGFTAGQMRFRLGSDVQNVSTDGQYADIEAAAGTGLAVRTGSAQPNNGAAFESIATQRYLEKA